MMARRIRNARVVPVSKPDTFMLPEASTKLRVPKVRAASATGTSVRCEVISWYKETMAIRP